jgi:serine/threonine protein phosphatase PrpC
MNSNSNSNNNSSTSSTSSSTGSTNSDIQTVFQNNPIFINKENFKLQLGDFTDIGGSKHKPNQDICFKIPLIEHNGYLLGVADGHGRDGHIIANISKECTEEVIQTKIDDLLKDPINFFEYLFDYIHNKIITNIGYNLKGGTTFSIILLLENKLWIANVGDSTGIIFSKNSIFKNSHLKYERDIATPDKVVVHTDTDTNLLNYLVLTSEGHSPENPDEYIRMRNFMKSPENENHAELLCVYDDPNKIKNMCPHVFNIEEDGIPTVRTDDGSFKYYYKNVRKDKATYVTCKNNFNSLASTRSIGDSNMNVLGVSNKPEIQSIDLNTIFDELLSLRQVNILKNSEQKDNDKDNDKIDVNPDPMTLCIGLFTDGVWDNWIYDHVCKFVTDKSCLNAIITDVNNGAQRVANSFMKRNETFANKNFGSSSDNSTGIIMYITKVAEVTNAVVTNTEVTNTEVSNTVTNTDTNTVSNTVTNTDTNNLIT